MTQLSRYFSLEELTITQQRGIDNTPPPEIIERLACTASAMEDVRALLGEPIIVSSGYRSPELNNLIGGSKTSAHCLGYAVDFICPSYGTPFEVARRLAGESSLHFDQLIYEQTWVHISFDPRMRHQLLTYQGGSYRPGIVK